MAMTASHLEAALRAAAKRHPRYAAVAVAIAVVYAVSAVWGAGYGVGRLLAQGESPKPAVAAG
ncbi:MAG TPA: hypothetical protein VF699_05580 [Caulobacteraceae bacterium]|jgi:hypothetical protein